MAKNILITGATTGIGRETALDLAAKGYRLFLLCRNEQLGQALCDEIMHLPPADGTAVETPMLLIADLGDMAQVKKAAEQFLSLNEPLHVLINNAGVMNTTRNLVEVNGTEQEQMFAVNHLGHFLLTQLLLPKLIETGQASGEPARIVVVASDAHAMFCKDMGFDDLSRANGFSSMKVYAQSKLANILMMHELVKKLNPEEVIINALHPGAVASSLGANNSTWYTKPVMWLLGLFFISTVKGAQTSIWLATADLKDIGVRRDKKTGEQKDVGKTGNYYYKCKLHRARPWGRDDYAAQQLWNITEQLLQPYL